MDAADREMRIDIIAIGSTARNRSGEAGTGSRPDAQDCQNQQQPGATVDYFCSGVRLGVHTVRAESGGEQLAGVKTR